MSERIGAVDCDPVASERTRSTTRRSFLTMLAAAAALLRLRPRKALASPAPPPAPKPTLWIGHF